MKRLERHFDLRWLVSTGAIWTFAEVMSHWHFRILNKTFGGCFFDVPLLTVLCIYLGFIVTAFWSALKDKN